MIRCNWSFIKLSCLISHLSFDVHQSITHFDWYLVLVDLVLNSIRKIEILASKVIRDRQRDTHKGIKSYRDLIALWTLQSRLKLSLKQINYDWLISFQMTFPMLLCDNFIRSIIWFTCLNIWLYLNSIEILMQRI